MKLLEEEITGREFEAFYIPMRELPVGKKYLLLNSNI